MIDREKVINQLDVDIQRAERTGEMLVCVGRKTARDALALLKEQEPVVRCRECKWHEMRGEMLLCKAQDKPHTYDWYCADVERRGTE